LYTILDQDNYAVEFLDPRTADELPAWPILSNVILDGDEDLF
jgi:hypothetical protein